MKNIFHKYSLPIWIRFIGQLFQATGLFSIGPFLTLYLYERLHMQLVTAMIIVSLTPFVALVAGVMGGYLADKYGRTRMMVISLAGQAVGMALLPFAGAAWQFALVNVLRGAFNSVYGPAADAQVADVVEADRRAEVYSLLHMGLNIGCAIGPVAGLGLYTLNPHLLFVTVGAMYGLTAVLFAVWLRDAKGNQPGPQSTLAAAPEPSRGMRRTVSKYGTVVWITFWTLPIYVLYGQIQSTFPIHLSHHFSNYTHMYAVILTFNALCVISLQMVIARVTRHARKWLLIAASFVAFGVVGFGYAWAPSLGVLLVAEFIYTIGEMIHFPQMQWFVSVIAPEELRGRYFAIYGLRWNFGMGLGPVIGGLVMQYASGFALFAGIGAAILLGGLVTMWMVVAKLAGDGTVRLAGDREAAACA